MKKTVKYSINLENFENPEFDDADYVLTSPRSLSAAKRSGVEPVNLLYKSFNQFKDELVPDGIPIEEVHCVYEAHEEHRKKLIELCKSLRNRAISEDESRRTFVRSSSAPRVRFQSQEISEPRRATSTCRKSYDKSRDVVNDESGEDLFEDTDLYRRLNNLENEIKNCEKLLSRYSNKERKKVSFFDEPQAHEISLKKYNSKKDPYIELINKNNKSVNRNPKEREKLIEYRKNIARDMFKKEEMAQRRAQLINFERSNSASRIREYNENRIKANRQKIQLEKDLQTRKLQQTCGRKEDLINKKSTQKQIRINSIKKELREMEIERTKRRLNARSFDKMDKQAKIVSSALRTR